MPDPISVFPPEVAWRCIYEALPFRGERNYSWYPEALLQLTTVSRRWEDLILSTSSFWVEVHMHNRAEDMLATLATFLSPSREIDLELVIWDYPINEWNRVQELLLPHVPRIRVLAHLAAGYHDTHAPHPLLTSLTVIKDLNLAPYLKELDFGQSLNINPLALGDLTLPSHIKVTTPVYGPLKEDELSHQFLEHITTLEATNHIDDIVPALCLLTNISTLTLWGQHETFQRNNREDVIFTAPPHLKAIRASQHSYCPNLKWLIILAASSLSFLSIPITVSEIGEVVDILPLLTMLQNLELFLYGKGETLDVSYTYTSTHTAIPSLRSLYVQVHVSPDYGPTSFDGLFAAFSPLYTCVVNVTFDMSPIPNMAVAYLQGLRHLEVLRLERKDVAMPAKCRELFLPSLQELDANGWELIQFINAPNLISLRNVSINWGEELEKLGQLRFFKLQNIYIFTSTKSSSPLIPQPDIINSLRRVSIVFINNQAVNKWTFTSLPLPTSIFIGTSFYNLNSVGNTFCTQLIYYPETCPSLREIAFNDYVEWDLLFIMLEQRNLGRKNVARIEKVSVPFVPFGFRQSLLELLLGQQRQDGLTNIVLSLEETRELLFNPSIPGCVNCIKNMRLGCTATVQPKRLDDPEQSILHPFDIGRDVSLGKFPSIHEWMVQRKHLVDKWKVSYKKFASQFSRDLGCYRHDSGYMLF
ncbi:hypothetical protein M408DRAFT_22334 [Serendipita vermifera MAFF 305830]|uniref:Uncharacterized protein n=1 Tax=Serendipita vermifera MAFF 305830 TaxID=933852 RepID=A0A0C2WW01_SERVB|nr:hypothetical protein M408DRAFT_22334 [Serendipita vermifera MAFF 305830]